MQSRKNDERFLEIYNSMFHFAGLTPMCTDPKRARDVVKTLIQNSEKYKKFNIRRLSNG